MWETLILLYETIINIYLGMRKLFIAMAAIAMTAFIADAEEGYNRVGLSSIVMGLSPNDDYKSISPVTDDQDGADLYGVGFDYIHGFPVAKKLFVEVGASVDISGCTSKTDKIRDKDYDWIMLEEKLRNVSLRVPVNLAYSIRISDNVTLVPFLGLNLRMNVVYKLRDKITSSLPDYRMDTGWLNLLSSSEDNMGSSALTWNRFQVGWQAGFGFNISKFYVGVEGGTDFVPAYSYSQGDVKLRVNSVNMRLSVAYTL